MNDEFDIENIRKRMNGALESLKNDFKSLRTGIMENARLGLLIGAVLLAEIIFSLDGLGLLGFEAAINRDYPIMFATLYFFTLLGLFMNIIGDLAMTFVDPRIDFNKR